MYKHLIVPALVAALFAPAVALADVQLTAAGSTALLPLMKQSAAEYQAAHPDVKISVSGGGSFVGINQATSGSADMGDSDVIAPGKAGLTDHKVAVVGFGIIANPSSGVRGLSAKQIRDVFAGRVTNWKDLGGADQSIVVINRPRSSGTRFVFTATIMGLSKINDSSLIEDSSGTVVTTVGNTPGAISYVSLGYAKNRPVTVLSVNGVSPNDATIRTGKYPIWSYEHVFTKGGSNGAVEAFIKYVTGNTAAIEKLGFISVSTMKVKELNR
jgi:phosphate transport system substrate-binding protein